jgi:hypothetical protein
MDRHRLGNSISVITLAASSDSVLFSAFVPGLINTVLFQPTRLQFGARPALGLYALYREGDATFDATVRLDARGDMRPLDDVLLRFLRSNECLSKVIEPVAVRVAAHFRR